MRTRAGLLVLLLALHAGGALAHGAHPEAGIAYDQHVDARLPTQLAFTDDTGRAVRLADELGTQPVVLVLGYLGCRDLCALTLKGVAESLARSGLVAGRDYRALFVSIDPRDTVAELAKARRERLAPGERAGWRFLAPQAGSLAPLASAVGFRYRYEPERDAFAHPAGFVVVKPDGTLARYFFGVRFDSDQVRTALEDAARGKPGTLTDRLLLFCYHFDPATGRYTLAILHILDGLIAISFVAAAFFAWRHVRARRRIGHP